MQYIDRGRGQRRLHHDAEARQRQGQAHQRQARAHGARLRAVRRVQQVTERRDQPQEPAAHGAAQADRGVHAHVRHPARRYVQ